MRYTALAVVLLLTACSESSPVEASTSTSPAPPAATSITTTETPAATTSTSTTTSTTAATTTTLPEAEPALPDGFTALPVPDEELGLKGLNVSYWEPMRHWSRGDNPMNDPTVYAWGCPECSPDPGPDHIATFADWIAAGLLEAWDHPDRLVAIGGPTIDDPELEPQHPRAQFRNLHYVAIHKPSDDHQEWMTWYLYLDGVDGELVLVGIAADMWIP